MRARAIHVLLTLGLLGAPTAAQIPPLVLGKSRASVDSLVSRFYEHRGARPAWIDSAGDTTRAALLRRVISRADDEGLDPADYATAPTESLLTTAFFAYARDVSRGRISPAAIDSEWQAASRPPDLVQWLDRGLDSATMDAVLQSLPPPQQGYAALRLALARYRTIAERGGWSPEPPGPPLARGARGPRVETLRERLIAEGYASPKDGPTDRFDPALEAAVREFQRHHGLTPDGVVGAATRVALNVSAPARARQIALNLERWRWLPRSLGGRYIVVNSPAFTLDVVEQGRSVLGMRAIVGLPDRPTPIVTSRVTDLLFRPVWRVPHSIAVDEILPLARRDPDYFARLGMRVFADSAAGGRELDPATIDWTAVTESTFAYQLAQEPGPANPLGGVKLVFWTPFNVFIHDSPARPLFSERLRAFSHGCVRVAGAAALAAYLLPGWSEDSIHTAMTVGRDRRLRLTAPVPVYLVYFTAWVDDDGVIEFRNDVYGWDERLRRALAPVPAMPLWIP